MRKRTLTILGTAIAVVAASATSASATSPQASCVAAITSYEATQLLPGSVGDEVSGLARSGANLGALVSPLAPSHGSIESCTAGD